MVGEVVRWGGGRWGVEGWDEGRTVRNKPVTDDYKREVTTRLRAKTHRQCRNLSWRNRRTEQGRKN